ncbi:hypothetical protein NPIL_508621 [Nephila pilipes]|uniref:Uncharacterized protein n=1 Tax=Nephila pilipes TaxID=299642 RepID=A0A8X6MJD4_NEPPI|nr:hypothetical protein NPIL_508621 [Nephila pilipes]
MRVHRPFSIIHRLQTDGTIVGRFKIVLMVSVIQDCLHGDQWCHHLVSIGVKPWASRYSLVCQPLSMACSTAHACWPQLAGQHRVNSQFQKEGL